MNSWNLNQNQNQNQNNMMMGQAQFTPYSQNMWGSYTQRLPVYHAEPIHGENAAWQFPMGPNSEIYLPDADQDLIWWIRTDNFGNKMVKPFKVTPYEEPAPITLEDVMKKSE